MGVPVHETKYYKELSIEVDASMIKNKITEVYKQELEKEGYELSHIAYPNETSEYYYYYYKKEIEIVVASL